MGNPAGGQAVSDETLSEYEQSILTHVEKFGCSVTHVFDPDQEEPDFSYSIGFSKTLDQGEVIVFGLARNLMQSMINEVMRQCREDGLILGDNVVISDLLEGFDVIARTIHPDRIEHEFFNSAIWFHRREFGTELKVAYQLVWPGTQQGLFPWDEGCDPYVIEQQPPLYELEVAGG